MKKLRPLILFLIGGLIYVFIELTARGRSHWTMFVVGGLAFFLVGCINEKYRKMPLVKQMAIGAIVITTLEFLCGYIVNLWLGWNVWDYSNMPLNLFGQICLTKVEPNNNQTITKPKPNNNQTVTTPEPNVYI